MALPRRSRGGVRRIAGESVLLTAVGLLLGVAGGGRGKAYRNALLLGSDWLPDFRFVAGERECAERAIRSGDSCIITEMMARARQEAGQGRKEDCLPSASVDVCKSPINNIGKPS